MAWQAGIGSGGRGLGYFGGGYISGDPHHHAATQSMLLDVDKVDLITGGYRTNTIVPTIPLAMQHGMTLMSLFGLNTNQRFNYDRYFQIGSAGPDPAETFTRGYFDLAAGMKPTPKTVAGR